jgi:hypothetical protein
MSSRQSWSNALEIREFFLVVVWMKDTIAFLVLSIISRFSFTSVAFVFEPSSARLQSIGGADIQIKVARPGRKGCPTAAGSAVLFIVVTPAYFSTLLVFYSGFVRSHFGFL